jgi:hypothetical protein
MNNRIIVYIENHRWKTLFFLSVAVFIISFVLVLLQTNANYVRQFYYLGLLLLAISIFGSFWEFYSSDKRLEHQITSFHGSSLLSAFYRIFFPVVLLAVALQILILFALAPEEDNGWGVLDPDLSPSSSIAFIFPAIIMGIAIIGLADFEMKKKKLRYAPPGKQFSYILSLLYMLPLLGLYYGIKFFVKFSIEQIWGKGALIQGSRDYFTIDKELINAARFWVFLTQREQIMTLIAFVALYTAIEVLFRGLVASEARNFGLGPGGIVFIPATIQAVALTSGTFIYTDTILYFYTLFEVFIFGVFLGIVLWRTGRFSAVLTMALVGRAFDNSLDFFTTIMHLLPSALGDYDPADSLVTDADKLAAFLLYIQIILVILAPLVLLISYEEVSRISQQLYENLRSQWFGYLIIALAFFIIDLVFDYFASQSFITPVVGFIISLLVISVLLNYLFRVLPPPRDIDALVPVREQFEDEWPVNVLADINWIEKEMQWYEYPNRAGAIGGFIFLYLLFITGTYRNYQRLNGEEILIFTSFLVVLPTILFILSSYLLSRSVSQGFFFADNYRKGLLGVLVALFVINLYIWAIASATTSFSWRSVPLFTPFILLIWSKPIRSPAYSYSVGLSHGGRYATFRNVEYLSTQFEMEINQLLELQSNNVQIGTKILCAKLSLCDEWGEIESLRNENASIGLKIGGALAIGMIGSQSSEGILLNLLGDEDINVKIAAFWALGKVGSQRALHRMAQVLEENPLKQLVKTAENAILSIDPNFPLAGLRDSIVID